MITRPLAGRILLCRLLRADGSRFAEARIDRLRQVLAVRFYRTSGTLLFAADAAYPATARTEGARVSCDNAATSSIGKGWRQPIRWRLATSATGIPRSEVVHALRAAQSQWTNNINWCGHADRADSVALYEGSTTRRWFHDETNTIDWGSLRKTQNCHLALACAISWYDPEGFPVESDVRFSAAAKWAVRREEARYDIQSVAAHEFGHMRQFGHVATGEPSVVMWPYVPAGETSGRKLGRGDSRGNNKNY